MSVYEELKQKVAAEKAGSHVEFTIADNINLILLRGISPLVNLLYASSTGRGDEDFAMNEIFSEAMDQFINNYPNFLTEVFAPLQGMSIDNLAANYLNQTSSHENLEENYNPDQMIGQDASISGFVDKSL